MDRVHSSGSDLDLDIDLESGGTTSEEDAIRSQVLRCEDSKNLLGRIRSGFTSSDSLCASKDNGDCSCSCSYDKCVVPDDISNKNEQLGKFREEMINFVNETMDEKKPKKKHSKPPRPPRGPLLGASDMKLLKEISELHLNRRRMERSLKTKKIKKEKSSSLSTNLFACVVTIVFFMVIIFQGLLGSRVGTYFDNTSAVNLHGSLSFIDRMTALTFQYDKRLHEKRTLHGTSFLFLVKHMCTDVMFVAIYQIFGVSDVCR